MTKKNSTKFCAQIDRYNFDKKLDSLSKISTVIRSKEDLQTALKDDNWEEIRRIWPENDPERREIKERLAKTRKMKQKRREAGIYPIPTSTRQDGPEEGIL